MTNRSFWVDGLHPASPVVVSAENAITATTADYTIGSVPVMANQSRQPGNAKDNGGSVGGRWVPKPTPAATIDDAPLVLESRGRTYLLWGLYLWVGQSIRFCLCCVYRSFTGPTRRFDHMTGVEPDRVAADVWDRFGRPASPNQFAAAAYACGLTRLGGHVFQDTWLV